MEFRQLFSHKRMLLHSINLMPGSGNDHNQGSRCKQKHPDDRLGIDRLMQEEKCQDQRQYGAHLVNRHDLRGFPDLKRPVITEP